jgi:hypothetical protein
VWGERYFELFFPFLSAGLECRVVLGHELASASSHISVVNKGREYMQVLWTDIGGGKTMV